MYKIVVHNSSKPKREELEDYFRSALLIVIDDAIGKEWKIEFHEAFSVPGLTTFEAYIVAPDVVSYFHIEKILKERLSKEYTILGRDMEYTGTVCSFLCFDRSILHSFISYDSFNTLSTAVLYAALFD
jgi:hypothetical protein